MPIQSVIRAYVVSKDDDRWQKIESLLLQCGLNPLRIRPVDTGAAREYLRRWPGEPSSPAIRLMSLTLTFDGIARAIATDPSLDDATGYSLVFEDDAALNEHVDPEQIPRIVHTLAAASTQLGFFSMGMCNPWCSPLDHASFEGVAYARCLGYCLHSYGLFKHAAGQFWESLLTRVVDQCTKSQMCDSGPLVSADVRLFNVFSGERTILEYPILAGANLTGHEFGGMLRDIGTGLFYQANSVFPAMMWRESVEGALDRAAPRFSNVR